MNKAFFAIWFPLLCGVILIIIVPINLNQFEMNEVDIHTILNREIPIVLVGMLSSVIIFFSGLYWLFRKQWSKAIQSVCSVFLFFICFGVGGAMGGAFLNAT